MKSDDGIYEGFDVVPSTFDPGSIFSSQNVQKALKTASRGRRPTVKWETLVLYLILIVHYHSLVLFDILKNL